MKVALLSLLALAFAVTTHGARVEYTADELKTAALELPSPAIEHIFATVFDITPTSDATLTAVCPVATRTREALGLIIVATYTEIVRTHLIEVTVTRLDAEGQPQRLDVTLVDDAQLLHMFANPSRDGCVDAALAGRRSAQLAAALGLDGEAGANEIVRRVATMSHAATLLAVLSAPDAQTAQQQVDAVRAQMADMAAANNITAAALQHSLTTTLQTQLQTWLSGVVQSLNPSSADPYGALEQWAAEHNFNASELIHGDLTLPPQASSAAAWWAALNSGEPTAGHDGAGERQFAADEASSGSAAAFQTWLHEHNFTTDEQGRWDSHMPIAAEDEAFMARMQDITARASAVLAVVDIARGIVARDQVFAQHGHCVAASPSDRAASGCARSEPPAATTTLPASDQPGGAPAAAQPATQAVGSPQSTEPGPRATHGAATSPDVTRTPSAAAPAPIIVAAIAAFAMIAVAGAFIIYRAWNRRRWGGTRRPANAFADMASGSETDADDNELVGEAHSAAAPTTSVAVPTAEVPEAPRQTPNTTVSAPSADDEFGDFSTV